jgi:hypothetical protein
MRNLGCFYLLLLTLSCAKLEEKHTIVKIDLKSLNDEKIQFFYTNNKIKYFTDELMFANKIEGSTQFQTVEFKLPKNFRLNRLRIDLGENKLETPIFIKNINISYGNKIIEIDENNMNRFFSTNIYLKTSDFVIFERSYIAKKYDPFLKSTALLEKKMFLEFR